ncbi:cytochrome P450 [Biscogniauxia mediterranea]|nr:cytochrome P450 [Biscogniauxia mediterranea]
MGLTEAVLDPVSIKAALIFLGITFALWRVYLKIDEITRLRRLGRCGPKLNSSFPFGIDIIWGQIRSILDDTSLEHFFRILETTPNYTGESRVLGTRLVATIDPENIKAILTTKFQDFGKGEPFHRQWSEFLGDGIFATDGQLWHNSRHLLRPQFSKERVSDLHCLESHLQTLFKAIANGGILEGVDQKVDLEAGNGKPVDIGELFFSFALDTSTSFLLGTDVQSLTNPHEPFAQAFDRVQKLMALRTRAGPLDLFVPLRQFHKDMEVVNRMCDRYIDQALRLTPDELASWTRSDQEYTFLHELAQFTRDRKVIRDQVVGVLLAGRDTTASTLSFALYLLARRPDAVRRLRREILATVGPDRPPTYADLKAMKYLQNVMNETLRLYPVLPYNLRLALRDTTLPRGGGPTGDEPLPVLKDTPVWFSPLAMQRRRDLYPPAEAAPLLPDPAVWCPDRWLAWQPRPWNYIPFSGGPRICIGQQFALTEMAYVLTRMFQRYERVESLGPDADPRLKVSIVVMPADGVKVAFWEAKENDVGR